jgi:hypothetical protein
MGTENDFVYVKLFCGLIFQQSNTCSIIKHRLTGIYSEIDIESVVFPFTFTNYYFQEMGEPLFKQFIGFSHLIHPEQLPDIKRHANQLEIEFSLDKRRTVNIDPGYISNANVIIATTKNHYHRIPLQKGIYAHMEYVIKKKQFFPLEWTYPDFKSSEYLNFFFQLNEKYKLNLSQMKKD